MGITAGFNDRALTDKRFKLTGDLDKKGPVVVLAAGEVSDLTDTAEHPPGTVVCLDSDDGKCYRADSANGGDRNAAASVQSLEAPDTDWDGETITIAVFYPDGTGVEKDVLAAATDDTIAELVALINADPVLEGHVIASDAGAGDELVIETVKKGAVGLKVTSTLASAFGAAGQSDRGVEAKYFVTDHWAYLKNGDGTGRDYQVSTIRAGDFDTSELSGLTDEARAYLERMGSQFD
jgi:hypothetical protein